MDLKTGPTRVDISSCMHAHHGTVAVAAGVVIGHWAVTLSDPRPRLDHDWTTTPPQLDHKSTTAQQSTAPDSHHIDPAAAVQAA